MNINPQAASLAQKDVQQAAMTQADIEAARKSRSALNGKKIYMLHQQAQPVPTQQTLNFDENAE